MVEIVREALKGGASMIQYRYKSGNMPRIAETLRALTDITRFYNVPLIVNDYVEIAKETGADGVHLGQGDMSPAKAREVLGGEAIIGVTAFEPAHFEALDLAVVDYAGTGPVYETKTDKGKPVLGPEGLEALVDLSPVPVVGVGGITPGNAAAVIEAGADGVAMMRAVSEAADPQKAAYDFLNVVAATRLREVS